MATTPFGNQRGGVTSAGGNPLYAIDPAVLAALQPRAIYGQTENDFGALLGYDNTLRFTDNGTDYIADFDGGAMRIQPYIDTGGGWLGNHHLDRYNGVGYDVYNQDRQYVGGGDWQGLSGAPGSWAALATAFGGPLLGAGLAGAAGAAGAGGAAGGAAGGTGALGAGAGGLGGATAADIGMMYAGADAAAAAGLGAAPATLGGSVGGTAAMGAGASALGGGGTTAGGLGSSLSSLGGLSEYLGPLSTLAGGLLGSQGQENESSMTRQLPDFLQGPVANDLVPRTMGLLGQTMPQAQAAGNQMLSVGSGLLGQKAPTTATNPYATGILDDMERRYNDMIAKGLNNAQGQFIGAGGLGNSRQGIAQSNAITQGADNFAGQGFNFMGGLYNQDQNRLRQDWTLGAGLLGQGIDTQYQPLKNTASVYSPFTGFGSTTQSQETGGGWGGAIGGALGAAQFGKNQGWW